MDAHEDAHHDPEQIRRSMRVYLIVFASLAVLTGVTVYACFGLKLPERQAIVVAMAVAIAKGSLVAAFFMHLLSEKKLIYAILALTVAFFILLMWLPSHDVLDKFHY